MDLRSVIGEYIEKARLMQVATVAGDQPWCSSVMYAFDEAWNLYWISLPTSRHSQELVANNKVAGTIADAELYASGPRGLQFEGVAEEVPDSQFDEAIKVYCARMNRDISLGDAMKSGNDSHKLYRITPSSFVLFDRVNFPENERQVLELG